MYNLTIMHSRKIWKVISTAAMFLIDTHAGAQLGGRHGFYSSHRFPVNTFQPAQLFFAGDSSWVGFISIAGNTNADNGYINELAFISKMPDDTTTVLKGNSVMRFQLADSIRYIQLKDGSKLVFQQMGHMSFLMRVLYESPRVLHTCLYRDSWETLTSKTATKESYNTFFVLKDKGPLQAVQGVAMYSPKFAARRSEKAFVKMFAAYPAIVQKLTQKDFYFDAAGMQKLLQQYSEAQ